MESDDRSIIEETLDDLTSSFDGDQLTKALDEFGWTDLMATDPPVAIAALFRSQGRHGSWSSGLHDVLATARVLPGVDPRMSVVVVPRPGSEAPAGARDVVDGFAICPRPGATEVVAVRTDADSCRVLSMPMEDVHMERASGLDARLELFRVTGTLEGATVRADGADARAWWGAAVSAGRRALSFQLCGAMEAITGLAVDHAIERHQFGRPVGAFQAVRHRLAECRVAQDGALAAAEAAFDGPEPELSGLVAKVVAGRAASVVTTHGQQVLAGIGFTAEHPFHTFLFRVATLDRLLGSANELAPLLGHELVRRGGAVRLVDL